MKKIKIFIGYDRASRIPASVLTESILEHSSIPVEFVYLHRGTLQNIFTRPHGEFDSTEFSNSSFWLNPAGTKAQFIAPIKNNKPTK